MVESGAVPRSRRTYRPVLWIVFGSLAVVAGAGMLIDGLSQLGKPHDLSAVAPCEVAFSDGCVTRRSAVVLGEGYAGRGSWLTRERLYHLDAGPVPGANGRGRLSVELDRQPHRDELSRGRTVTVIFYGRRAEELDVGGFALLGQEHPVYAGPDRILYGIAGVAMGMFAVAFGWPAARQGRLWTTRRPASAPVLLASVACLAMVAAVARVALGHLVWVVLTPLVVWLAVVLRDRPWKSGRHARP